MHTYAVCMLIHLSKLKSHCNESRHLFCSREPDKAEILQYPVTTSTEYYQKSSEKLQFIPKLSASPVALDTYGHVSALPSIGLGPMWNNGVIRVLPNAVGQRKFSQWLHSSLGRGKI